jgi:hypothetical protein
LRHAEGPNEKLHNNSEDDSLYWINDHAKQRHSKDRKSKACEAAQDRRHKNDQSDQQDP